MNNVDIAICCAAFSLGLFSLLYRTLETKLTAKRKIIET